MLARLQIQTRYRPEGLPTSHMASAACYHRHLQLPFIPTIGMQLDTGDGESLNVEGVRWNATIPTEIHVVLEDDRSHRSHCTLLQHGWRLGDGKDVPQRAEQTASPPPSSVARTHLGRKPKLSEESLTSAITMLNDPSMPLVVVASTFGVTTQTLLKNLKKQGWKRSSIKRGSAVSPETVRPPAISSVPLPAPPSGENLKSKTYLTTDQLAERIHYDARTIRDCMKDTVLLEGVHYCRPFGGRKLLFIWEAIERDIESWSQAALHPVVTAAVDA